MSGLARVIRVAIGVILVALVTVPVYLLLDSPRTGLAGQDAMTFAVHARNVLMLGTGIMLVLAAIAARAVGTPVIEGWVDTLGKMLDPAILPFAAALAAVSAMLTVVFSLAVLQGMPNLVDAMTQLLHARYLAAGMLAAPAAEWSHFWHVQNSVVTPAGWVSQYPPGYPVMLAAGLKLGAVWLVGPLLAGMTVFFTTLVGDRLFPHDRRVARLGCVMLAISPFFIGLAGAYMNHVAAAAFVSLALYLALRSMGERGFIWAVGAGAALSTVFSVRPLAAVVAAVVVAGIWASQPVHRHVTHWIAATIGAAPLLALVGLYNAHLFGSPFRFAYTYAQGPSVNPGFRVDPWGNVYGLREALAYTSSDLTNLSLALLETPLPAVVIVGLFLIFARRLSFGERIIALWALLPVLANAFYWHHGVFMGPRMLNEAAPAWCLLLAVSAVGLVRLIPQRAQLAEYSLRGTVVAAYLLAFGAALAYLAPERLVRYRSFMPSTRLDVARTNEPALVFVHGGWTARVAMKLAAGGMRLDSVETALRQNPTCRVHRFTEWYVHASREQPAPVTLEFTPRPGDEMPRVIVSRGNEIRHATGDELTPACLREIAADTLGVVDVSPLLWSGDLPGLNGDGVLFARDYGPAENRILLERYPERRPYVFYRARDDDEPPLLVPYEEGMAALWGARRGPE